MMVDPARLRLIVVTADRGTSTSPPLDVCLARLFAAGVTAVIYREKSLDDDDFAAGARRVVAVARATGAFVVVSERATIALDVGADAVQASWRSPDPTSLRAAAGSGLAIGVSVHDIEEGRRRAEEGADFLVLGPIHDTPKAPHARRAPLGVDAIRRLATQVRIPVVAIGGIDPTNAHHALHAGAAGVAALRPFSGADGEAVARRFRAAIDERTRP